jgi:hypothetical protein
MMSNMGEGPLARSADLIIEELGDEILVYDTKTDQGHSLSPEAAKVWRACNGTTSAERLSVKLGLDQDTVNRALEELSNCDLLEVRPTIVADGSTRREVTIKLAKVGAAAAAAPLILSVAAPAAYAAATVRFCGQFSSGNCGANTGCSSTVGCCCCTPPVDRDKNTGLFPPGPCRDNNASGTQCKSCVPTQLQTTLCPEFGHGDGTSCSAGG